MHTTQLPSVSIIMPVRNESGYIERSLRSLLLQDYPSDLLEILIADGDSTDDTKTKIRRLCGPFPHIRVHIVDNPRKYMPMGFNRALKQAEGEIIIMMGGHAELAPNYITQCVQLLKRYPIDCVGGAMETISSGWISRAIATAMGSAFGVGGVAFRTRPDKVMEVDTAVFAAYRRSVFEEIGCLDEEMIRNQDDEFNYRLRESGRRILFSPTVHSRYYSRSSLSGLWRQYYQYGYWKVRVLQKHPRQMSPRQFAPPLLVLGLLASLLLLPPVLGPLFVLRPLSLIIPLLYLLANLLASLYTAARHGWKYLPLLPVVFFILHTSYGLGFLVGLIRFWNRWRDKTGRTPVHSGEVIG